MNTHTQVKWEQLLPKEFMARLDANPVVYLPMGICEPHGHVAAFGLDTIKAEYLCIEAARRFGGIVAPVQGYHVHETGPHAPWLKEVVGDINPRLGGVPPDVILRMLVFQLRAFFNAGFHTAFVLTGHNGNQQDLRIAAEEFQKRHPITIVTVSDPELVAGEFEGDHAGRYEVSQLLYIRPDLVDLSRAGDIESSPLERFGQGLDVSEATREYGELIIERSLDAVGTLLDRADQPTRPDGAFMTIEDAEIVWAAVEGRKSEWITLSV